MRFLIRVAVDRTVDPPAKATLRLESPAPAAAWTLEREVTLAADGDGGLMPLPPPADVPVGVPPGVTALCGGAPVPFHAALADFRARRAGSANDFGRYLAAVLLGSDWWGRIIEVQRPAGDTLVELALAWPSDPALRPFERLPWELMALGPVPLVATDAPRVAITRVVTTRAIATAAAAAGPLAAGAAAAAGASAVWPAPLDLPPRVLFVVGTELRNPRIRAATEILHIVRGIEPDDRSLHTTLIEEATPAMVAAAVAAHRPQVVHFIGHGDVEDGEGWLEMKSDTPGQAVEKCGSARLLDMLKPGGIAPPTIVVLGACRSASNDDRAPGAPLRTTADLARAPGEPVGLASLGARLVAGGVPIVIGMSGRVSDVAARLFTVRFQTSVMAGEPLVSATAYARRAPFVQGGGANGSIDWAYPTVLLDERVDADYKPTPTLTPGQRDTLTTWIRALALTQEKKPVFCQRQEFLGDFDRLLRGDKGVLVAHVQPGDDDEGGRWGKTRLIEQFLFRALRQGHLPLAIAPGRREPPRQLVNVLDAIAKQVDFTVDTLQLDLADRPTLTGMLAERLRSQQGDQALADSGDAKMRASDAAAAAPDDARRARHQQRVRAATDLQAELRLRGGISGRAACLALRYDLFALADAFENRLRGLQGTATAPLPPWLASPHAARPVLLLDNIDQFEVSFVTALTELLNQGGLGPAEHPIPVVMTAVLDGGPTQPPLKKFLELQRSWLAPRPLEPFPDADAMLAYQAVLLHPFNPALFKYDNLSKIAFAPAASVPADAALDVENFFRSTVKGWPSLLAKGTLYAALKIGLDRAYFVRADDSDVLEALGLKR